MQQEVSAFHQKHFEQLAPSLQNSDAAVLNQRPPALVHSAWAGWHHEVPAEENVIPLFESARAAEDLVSRSDRVIAEFRIESAAEAATRVSDAVVLAELEAYAEATRGVLVTRHDFDFFSVALSSSVPFGVTIERDFTGRPRHAGMVNPPTRPADSMGNYLLETAQTPKARRNHLPAAPPASMPKTEG